MAVALCTQSSNQLPANRHAGVSILAELLLTYVPSVVPLVRTAEHLARLQVGLIW